MKKFVTTALIAALLASPLACAAPAQAAEQDQTVAFTPYTPVSGLYIQTPAYHSSTTGSKISILGASDPAQPVTINGQPVEMTSSGFFAACLPLTLGENYFEVKTPAESVTLTVVRKKPSKGAEPATAVKPLSAQYGVVKSDNITHRAGPSQESELLLPLARGTVCGIIGQCGSYYQLSDGTFIFKSAVEVQKEALPANPLSRASLREAADSVTTLAWQMPQQALYQVQLTADGATVTFWDTTSAGCQIIQPDKGAVTGIKRLSADNDRHSVFALTFAPDARVNGYNVSYADGALLLSFKQAPILTGQSLTGARVLLDAGHGGSDTGALGPAGVYGPREKDINLQITQYVKEYLESRGAAVLMNRTGDNASSLAQRAAAIIDLKPDAALSIHANSVANTSDLTKARGTLTFYTFDQDLPFATAINDAISQAMGWEPTPPRSSNLALTRTTTCPAALIETKFMSNPHDYQWLIDPANQKALGQAIGQALEAYLLANSR